MKNIAVWLVLAVLLTGVAAVAPAQTPGKPASPEMPAQPAPPAKEHSNAHAWLRILVLHMSNPDPRIRLSVREGLSVMGPQAVAAVNEGKAKEKNPHVKAFMTRTITYLKIKLAKNQGKRPGTPFWDIDHVAAVANLKWEQIGKTLPILVAAHKQNKELTATFREAGGSNRDPEAMQDLGDEMKAVAADTEAKLRKFLDPKQVGMFRRYFDPWRQWQAREKAKRERERKQGGR